MLALGNNPLIGVCSSNLALRRGIHVDHFGERIRQLGRVAYLSAVMVLKACSTLLCSLHVVVDVNLGEDRSGGIRKISPGTEGPRLDNGGADAEWLRFTCEGFRLALYGELGCSVARYERSARNAIPSADRYYMTLAMSSHNGKDSPSHIKSAEEIDLHLCTHAIRGYCLEEPGIEPASVVDQHVDGSEAFVSLTHTLLDSSRVCDIHRESEQPLVLIYHICYLAGVSSRCDNRAACF